MEERIVVIGGGASGLMAAYTAAKRGKSVLLIEKNEKLGKKIYITGKGRCNLTNDCPPDNFLLSVVRGRKFLTGAIYTFPSERTIEFFEENGLPLKTERGNRVFPVSDKASDVTKTLEHLCKKASVEIHLSEKVTKIVTKEERVCGIKTDKGEYACRGAIVCTGGLSYPSTGSTGDGYRFAKEAGHSVTPCVPSLTGLNTKENFASVSGLSVKNVVLSAKKGGKVFFSSLGELLFTHFGISGPLVLSLSAELNRMEMSEISLFLDFKPALDEKKLDQRLVRDFTERKNESMKNVMRGLLPASLGGILLKKAGIPEQKQANAVTREERAKLLALFKAFPISPVSLRDFEEAVVTSGGVETKEIDPSSMQSKKVAGLYFCGETLDVDALTGGYNLQIAFATGYMAGSAVK